MFLRSVVLAVFIGLVIDSFGHAQSSQYPEILEEAEKIKYSNPDKSLQLYNFIRKEGKPEDHLFASIAVFWLQSHLGNLEEAALTSRDIQPFAEKMGAELNFLYQLERAQFYHLIGFKKEAKTILNNAIFLFGNLSQQLQDKNEADLNYVIFSFDEDKEKGISEFKKSISSSFIPNSKLGFFFLELGKSYYQTQKDSAFYYFEKIRRLEEASSVLYITADSFLELKKRDKESQPPYIPFAKIVDEDSKLMLSEELVRFWTEQENRDSLVKYLDLQHRIIQQSELQKKKARVQTLEFYHIEQIARQHAEGSRRTMFYVIGSGIFLVGGFLVIFWRKKKVAEIETPKINVISDKAEEEILKKLEDFEHSTQFLDKNMRIAKLAKKLNTNTRYLSAIINSEKDRTFNSYINSLRIRYIVNQLQTDAQFLTYKVSYLAEVSGFISQSSFTTAFKEEMGKTPSVFIKEEIQRRGDVQKKD